MKRTTTHAAVLSVATAVVSAAPADAQGGVARGPAFGASWVLPSMSPIDRLSTQTVVDLSGRVHVGMAVPGGEVYVMGARLAAIGPADAFMPAGGEESWRDTDHSAMSSANRGSTRSAP